MYVHVYSLKMLKCMYISEELINELCRGYKGNCKNATFEPDLKSKSSQVTFQGLHEQSV